MGHTTEFSLFLNCHKEQLLSSGVPEYFWETLYQKLMNQVFDAGKLFQLLRFEFDDEIEGEYKPTWGLQALKDIKVSDPSHIYLIDHAWTFRAENAKNQLLENEKLVDRIGAILKIEESLPFTEKADKLYNGLWSLCNFYSINADNAEEKTPIWYIMDEVGSGVIHSDSPNCRVVPFVFLNEQITYSIIFPIEDIPKEDFASRDYAEGIVDEQQRMAALVPWIPNSFKEYNIIPEIPNEDYFLGGHIKETLPDSFAKIPQKKDKYKVFTQYSLVKLFLNDEKFEIVDSEEEAEILWYTQHFKNYALLNKTPEKFVNQFPFEYVMTIKDLLSITCRRNVGNNIKNFPDWLPITYNLQTEISNFLACHELRDAEGKENTWIVKPFNLARGIDMHITDNLNCILRLANSGPKIVQKYIHNPVLFDRPECGGSVKFDIRYVILLKSVKPLQAYVYRNFFLRFANLPFQMNDFHIYEKHFTVMNYKEQCTLRHIPCEEFKHQWEVQYGNYDWSDIEKNICNMLKEILEKAVVEKPPCGIAENSQSRALYAADIMLKWDKKKKIVPQILEINWTPDCKRACDYYPDFFNDIFKLLFLDVESDVFIKL